MAKRKKEKAPAYQWYPKDALSSASIAAMTLEAEGLYRHLLDHAWLENGLSSSDDDVFNISKCKTREHFDALWMVVEKRFPWAVDNRRRNLRQEVERKKQAKNRRKKKLAAKKSWQNRRGEKISTDASALQVQSPALALALAVAVASKDQSPIHHRAARAGLPVQSDRERDIKRLVALCDGDILQPWVAKFGTLPNADSVWVSLQMAAKGRIPVTEETAKAAATRALSHWTKKRVSA